MSYMVKSTTIVPKTPALLAGAVEYIDCTSAEGYPPPTRPLVGCSWRPIMLEDRNLMAEQSDLAVKVFT